MQAIPRTRRTPQNTQHTYSLSCRIYDVKIYPVQSPQGATIIIYGQENGISVVWRGGRRLKPQKQPIKEKRNGANSEDAVMVIDSDDESPAAAATPFVDKPEFDDNPTASSSSIPEIVQSLDLALGTAALHVAALPMPSCAAEEASWNGADILKTKIVIAVTCANTDAYLVTLPLTPPSHESKARPALRQSLLAGNAGTGVWGETLTLLAGQSRPCSGLAITLVKQKPGSRSRSLDRAAAQAVPVTRAIVAAHSREASGTLRLWDVTLDAKPGTTSRVEPFQTEYLPSPLTSISFNPSHVTQLLTVASPHAVRIYDYAAASLPSDDTSEGPFPTQGSWLLSLYPPFTRGPPMSTARKPIVASEWVAHGRAVLTLLADGQWGIWDIDGVSPSATSSGLFGKANAGLRGSAITSFCVSGHLEGTSPLRNPATQKLPAAPGSGGDFVPMTPHTRRDAITSAITGGSEKLAAVRGGIAVAQLSAQGTGPGEESAVLWLGGADPIVSVIPVISRFWDSQLRRAVGGGVNLWSGAQPTRMIRLTDLATGLLGERCTGAAAIPKINRSSAATTSNSPPAKESGSSFTEGLPIEVLLQGESRVVIVHESEDATSLTTRLLGTRRRSRPDLGSTKAILAYPRPEQPNSVAFNLSIAQRPGRGVGGVFRPRARPPVKGLFDQPSDVLPSTEAHDESQSAPSSQQGLVFINDLSYAADQPDDEFEAAGRDIEQELMDIMEIDRELEQLESERERGTKRVFFEEG
ncbi:Nucleoporin Nup37 [Madurella fahalii]|uniref:Nucleoporin Nup37 n=1 Tax=Madurella fahalii TaxID=1157608 RepID=A0ABQ0GJF8_9PEZI